MLSFECWDLLFRFDPVHGAYVSEPIKSGNRVKVYIAEACKCWHAKCLCGGGYADVFVVSFRSPWHAAHRLLRILMTEQEKENYWHALNFKRMAVNPKLNNMLSMYVFNKQMPTW